MNLSNIRRQSKETVSLATLEEKLPAECFEAMTKVLQEGSDGSCDDSIYQKYFQATATPTLTEAEQKELFEQLGNGWVKNHYSTDQLREFLDRPVVEKKRRNDCDY